MTTTFRSLRDRISASRKWSQTSNKVMALTDVVDELVRMLSENAPEGEWEAPSREEWMKTLYEERRHQRGHRRGASPADLVGQGVESLLDLAIDMARRGEPSAVVASMVLAAKEALILGDDDTNVFGSRSMRENQDYGTSTLEDLDEDLPPSEEYNPSPVSKARILEPREAMQFLTSWPTPSEWAPMTCRSGGPEGLLVIGPGHQDPSVFARIIETTLVGPDSVYGPMHPVPDGDVVHSYALVSFNDATKRWDFTEVDADHASGRAMPVTIMRSRSLSS